MEDNIGEKLHNCGNKLQLWASRQFGSVRKKKKELSERMAELQKIDRTEEIVGEIRQIEDELDTVLRAEETMWFQRSRALWLKDGDRNSKFYHQKATLRKHRNTIKEIENAEGRVCKKKEEICEVIREYFIKVFQKEGERSDAAVMNAIDSKVTPEMNEALTKPFTAEEVVIAIKQMHPAKAPGPNGMTPLFFQKFWSICKNDVLPDVLKILNLGGDPRFLNAL